MAQWVPELIAVPVDRVPIPNTHLGLYSQNQPLLNSLDTRQAHGTQADIHADKAPMHIKINKCILKVRIYWMLDPESLRKAVEIQWGSLSENYRDESGLIQSLVGQVSPCAQC